MHSGGIGTNYWTRPYVEQGNLLQTATQLLLANEATYKGWLHSVQLPNGVYVQAVVLPVYQCPADATMANGICTDGNSWHGGYA